MRSRSFLWLFLAVVLFLAPLSAAAASPQHATLSSLLGLPNTEDWVVGADKEWAGLGDTATSVGDVNGDGYEDLLVGAFGYHTVWWNGGRTYLFLGSASGLSATPAWMVEGGSDCQNEYCNIGRGIGAAGDVNGDGYDDVIVAACRWSSGQYDEGRAFVYYGSATGLSTTADWSVESNQEQAYLGWIAGTAGDVNGDGYDDIMIGAGGFDGHKGRVFLFLGSATGLSCGTGGCPMDATSAADWIVAGEQFGAEVGEPAAAAGDVNGDGYDDILVGAPGYDGAFTDEGRVWVYLGSSSGITSTAAWSVAGGQKSAWLGPGSGAAGDVNGDGYGDLLVAAYLYDNGQSDEGRVSLYLGSADGLATTPAWIAEGDQSGAYFGYAHISRVPGDLDGDGYADVIVGAFGYDNGETDEGRTFVYMGSPAGLTAAPVWSAEGNQPGALFGQAAGSAGDVNGDGHDDLFAGAPGYDLGHTDSGAAFAYYSRPPTAEAGGPYTVEPGNTIQLDGSGSFGYAAGDTLVYNWDLDGDGIYGESGPAAVRGDETGVTPTFSGVGLQAPLELAVKLRVTDQGGFSDGDAATVAIVDLTPPVVTVQLSQNTLWPPNHKLSTVTAQVSVDEPYSSLTVDVTSDEPDNGLGDGDTAGDIVIVGNTTFRLRAERAGGGDGRVYTITYQAVDPCGNVGTGVATVTVPHSQGNGKESGDAGAPTAEIQPQAPGQAVYLPLITR